MIVYFADRYFNIIGQASTNLPGGLTIIDDRRVGDVDSGVTVFEFTLPFNDSNRALAESCGAVGNYLLRSHGENQDFYTIIDAEVDTKRQEVTVYAEDAGLDLLNEIVEAYEPSAAQNIAHYINKFAYDSGFVIGVNECGSTTKKLAFTDDATAAERIAKVAEQFGCEISYSFEIDGLAVTKKLINIYKERGNDVGIQLRLNKEVDRIITKKSIANLATALLPTGGTPENAENPINLSGYKYDDGDIYLEGRYLKSRKAIQKWSRYLNPSEPNATYTGHILRKFSSDALTQAALCSAAVAELKRVSDIEVNYDIELPELPKGVGLGDRVNIVDDAGELYMSARVLKLEESVANKSVNATIGEYLIKDSGISQKVADLAAQFATSAAEVAAAYQAAQAAKTTAQATQVAVEELEIGGRNYVVKSAAVDHIGDWVKWQNSVLSLTDDGFLKVAPTAGDRTTGAYPPKESKLENGVEYTLSFEAYADADLHLNYNHIMCSSGNTALSVQIPITTTPAKYSYTFTASKGYDDCAIMLGHRNNAGITSAFYVKNIKVEKGNRPTDWTPAPEDVAEDIAVASKTATNFLSYDATNGLQVGNKTAGDWTGYRAQVKTDSFNILDADGTVLSTFGANEIDLGNNNEDTVISMCNKKATIRVDASAADPYYSAVKFEADNLELDGDNIYLYTENGDPTFENDNVHRTGTAVVQPDVAGLSTFSFEFGGAPVTADLRLDHGTMTAYASNGASITAPTIGLYGNLAGAIETGTWTARINAGTITTQKCTYQKVGDMCTISFFVQGTGVAAQTSGNYLYITGVPYSPQSGVNWYGGGGHVQGLKIDSGFYPTGPIIQPDGRIYYRTAQSNANAVSGGYAHIANGNATFYITGTITYPVAE